LRILIADDHPIMRIGLRQLIGSAWPDAIVDEAETVDEACRQAAQHRPDAIVLILVISVKAGSAFAARLLQMGAAGFLPKDMAATELVVALQRLLQGKRYVTAAMADHLVDLLGGRDPARPVHELLSTQEHRVMLLIASGTTPAQIAETMHLSVKTVGTYRARILEKTGWKNNVDLTKYCLQHGLTDQI